jgi:hypothetical protein
MCHHIEKEMPNVRKDVRELLQKTESDLASMGEERDSLSKMRMQGWQWHSTSG